jgi:RNA polymerase sigma factor (TIGR02999 family)
MTTVSLDCNRQVPPPMLDSASPAVAMHDRPVDLFFLQTYKELRKLARARLRRNENVTLLDTTSLVHECYLRLQHSGQVNLKQQCEFIAYASTTMRAVIVDFVRRRRAQRRGAGAEHEMLDTSVAESVCAAEEHLLDVNEALDMLSAVEPRLGKVVEMRYFGGFSDSEIAQALGVTDRTVRRDWEKARQMLRATMSS